MVEYATGAQVSMVHAGLNRFGEAGKNKYR